MTRRSQFARTVLTAATASLTFSAQILIATDCSISDTRFGVSLGSVFNITMVGFTNSEMQTAIGYWTGCAGYGSEIPDFQIGGSGGIPVTVVKIDGNSDSPGGTCGLFDPDMVNGRIESAEITVWTRESDGDPCAPLTDVIAHEFGHLLGLANAEDLACAGRIMGYRFPDSLRSVQSDDCEVADQKWETTSEANPVDPYCDAYCWTSCVNNACPARPPGMEGCPVLIDLENDGIRLTGLDDPVWFDIDADGSPDLMSWTDRGEGLLALDRDGNGQIDSGAELFGNYTRLSDGSRALNGYLALAELDSWSSGGNGDGFIDPLDAAFDSLWMWSDRNHDGVSQPEELQTLEEVGILRIGVGYKRSHRTDRHGNEFRFLGKAWKAGRSGVERPVLTWDVFFVVAADP